MVSYLYYPIIIMQRTLISFYWYQTGFSFARHTVSKTLNPFLSEPDGEQSLRPEWFFFQLDNIKFIYALFKTCYDVISKRFTIEQQIFNIFCRLVPNLNNKNHSYFIWPSVTAGVLKMGPQVLANGLPATFSFRICRRNTNYLNIKTARVKYYFSVWVAAIFNSQGWYSVLAYSQVRRSLSTVS